MGALLFDDWMINTLLLMASFDSLMSVNRQLGWKHPKVFGFSYDIIMILSTVFLPQYFFLLHLILETTSTRWVAPIYDTLRADYQVSSCVA